VALAVLPYRLVLPLSEVQGHFKCQRVAVVRVLAVGSNLMLARVLVFLVVPLTSFQAAVILIRAVMHAFRQLRMQLGPVVRYRLGLEFLQRCLALLMS